MAQIREFESTTESYFILDGVSYPKVYEAMYDDIRYSDTKIKLVPTNRDTNQLVFSTQYTNILVDGESFDTALEAISRLNQVVFSKGGGSGGGGTGDQNNIQKVISITLDDLGMTPDDSQEDIDEALVEYIELLDLTVEETEIYHFQVSGFSDTPIGNLVTSVNSQTGAVILDLDQDIIIPLSSIDEDLTDNIARKGFIATFPFKIINFQTTAYPVPTGNPITTQLRKNSTVLTTTHSVIPINSNNSTTSPSPAFSSDTFAIGDRLDFFTPSGGIGSTIKGQNLKAILKIKKL